MILVKDKNCLNTLDLTEVFVQINHFCPSEKYIFAYDMHRSR